MGTEHMCIRLGSTEMGTEHMCIRLGSTEGMMKMFKHYMCVS